MGITKITKRQCEVLEYLISFVEARGFPPTNDEIAKRFGILNNAAKCHLIALELKGYVSREAKHTARAVRVLKDSEGRRVSYVLFRGIGYLYNGAGYMEIRPEKARPAPECDTDRAETEQQQNATTEQTA